MVYRMESLELTLDFPGCVLGDLGKGMFRRSVEEGTFLERVQQIGGKYLMTESTEDSFQKFWYKEEQSSGVVASEEVSQEMFYMCLHVDHHDLGQKGKKKLMMEKKQQQQLDKCSQQMKGEVLCAQSGVDISSTSRKVCLQKADLMISPTQCGWRQEQLLAHFKHTILAFLKRSERLLFFNQMTV